MEFQLYVTQKHISEYQKDRPDCHIQLGPEVPMPSDLTGTGLGLSHAGVSAPALPRVDHFSVQVTKEVYDSYRIGDSVVLSLQKGTLLASPEAKEIVEKLVDRMLTSASNPSAPNGTET